MGHQIINDTYIYTYYGCKYCTELNKKVYTHNNLITSIFGPLTSDRTTVSTFWPVLKKFWFQMSMTQPTSRADCKRSADPRDLKLCTHLFER